MDIDSIWVAQSQATDRANDTLRVGADMAIAVLIPCYNEEAAVGTVVRDFQQALPVAKIYVYDNNSTDRTVAVARDAGAIVRQEPLRGKGNVVRRMFADIDADIYVLVDGDDTYHAASAPRMIRTLLDQHLDLVNAVRVTDIKAAYRPGHKFGNAMFTRLISIIFGNDLKDMLSGYRVLSRRFVKSFPALATGFEIETELSVHALDLHLPLCEIETPYKDRPPGSLSKLRTYYDGWHILRAVVHVVKEERPLQFFTSLSTLLFVTATVLSIPILLTFMRTGLVPRLPTAVLAMGIMLLSFLSLACGLILDTVTHGRREALRMHYLAIPLSRHEEELGVQDESR